MYEQKNFTDSELRRFELKTDDPAELADWTGSSKRKDSPEETWALYFYILAFDLDLTGQQHNNPERP